MLYYFRKSKLKMFDQSVYKMLQQNNDVIIDQIYKYIFNTM